MVLGVQVAGALFGVFMIYLSFLANKRNEFSKSETGLWCALWTLFIIVSLFPQVLQPIVLNLKLYRTMDLFTITGFLFLISLTFCNYSMLRRNQNKLEEVVRKIAHERAKK